jgi:hypothetical protein
MKQRNFILLVALLGVFIFIIPRVSAQNTRVPVEDEKAAAIRKAEMEHQEVIARERARARAIVGPRDDYVWVTGWGSGEHNSRLMLSKRYNGQTVDKQGTFEVEDKITKLKLSIEGQVNSGSITVSLILPDGKPYKSLTMDDSADISWSESLNIKEGENKYYGTWKYRISTKVADGSYHLSINSY